MGWGCHCHRSVKLLVVFRYTFSVNMNYGSIFVHIFHSFFFVQVFRRPLQTAPYSLLPLDAATVIIIVIMSKLEMTDLSVWLRNLHWENIITVPWPTVADSYTGSTIIAVNTLHASSKHRENLLLIKKSWLNSSSSFDEEPCVLFLCSSDCNNEL